MFLEKKKVLCETIFHFSDYYFYLFKNLEVFNRFDYTKNLFRKKSFPGNKKIFHVRNHYEIITFETKWKENVWRNIRQLIFWRAMFLFFYFFAKHLSTNRKCSAAIQFHRWKKKNQEKEFHLFAQKIVHQLSNINTGEKTIQIRDKWIAKKITALGPSGLP